MILAKFICHGRFVKPEEFDIYTDDWQVGSLVVDSTADATEVGKDGGACKQAENKH